MKIGILTFHRAHNYGAVLQCYALQEVLKAKGHDISVINYLQPHVEKLYKPQFNILVIIKKILLLRFSKLKDYLTIYKKNKRSQYNFYHFRETFLKCTEECNADAIPQDFDIFIVGSDQMWSMNCTQGYEPVYWGNFKRHAGSKLIGYAISANGDYHNVLSDDEIKKHTNLFDALTFREESTCIDLEYITGKKYLQTIDPTLLTTSNTWNHLLNDKWSNREYVAVYQVRFSQGMQDIIPSKAKVYAQKHGLEVIDLSGMDYSVEDFVSILNSAQCVFTSSFHAVVFSIIFRTPFVIFMLNDKQDGRYVSLLQKLGLESHLRQLQEDNVDNLLGKKVEVGTALDEYRKTSLNFIDQL